MKNKKKLIVSLSVLGVVVAAICSIIFIDLARSKQFVLTLKGKTADQIIADGTSAIQFRVELTRKEQPVEGHVISIFASNGSLPASRQTTDENGIIKFTYYPYLFVNEKVSPLEDVEFTLKDESNSIFFLIPATLKFSLPSIKGESSDSDTDWQGLDIINYEEE